MARAVITNWSPGLFRARAAIYEHRLLSSIEGVFQAYAPQMQADMQAARHSRQRWQDHTGHARQGLRARTEREGSKVHLDLFGKVPGAVQYNVALGASPTKGVTPRLSQPMSIMSRW